MTLRDYTARLAALAEPVAMADPFRPARNVAMGVCAAHDEGDLVGAGQACGDLIAMLETAAAEAEAAAKGLRETLAQVTRLLLSVTGSDLGNIRRWLVTPSASGCPHPGALDRASLSPVRAGRFGQRLPYRGGL